jgi:PAS domain S-box-containing protein
VLVLSESLTGALERLVTETVDVILLDLWLPDSEGMATCHRVASKARNIPIVVMTGTDDRTLATEAMHSGAQDYLVKGAFPGSAIVRVLQYAIDRYHFQRELAQRESHYHQVLNHVPAIIWTTDSKLSITSAMGAGLQLLDLDPNQIVGKRLEEYFRITGEAEGAVRAHQRALHGESVAFETEWHGRTFEVKLEPLHEPEQAIGGAIGIALDVTDRRALDREINFARLVQEALLPAKHPQLAGFDIFGGSYPARQTCGD